MAHYSVCDRGFFVRLDLAFRERDRRFEVLFARELRTADDEGRGTGERDFVSEYISQPTPAAINATASGFLRTCRDRVEAMSPAVPGTSAPSKSLTTSLGEA
jgi:hypothetical protein